MSEVETLRSELASERAKSEGLRRALERTKADLAQAVRAFDAAVRQVKLLEAKLTGEPKPNMKTEAC